MTTFHRALLAVLFAAWLAMPSLGDEGGENASGGGVWILPCAAIVDESALEGGGSARGQLAQQAINADIRMQVSSNMGSASAVLVSCLSGDPLPLPVEGSNVVISRELLQTLALGKTAAQILIVDSQQNGYVIDLTIDATGSTATLQVR